MKRLTVLVAVSLLASSLAACAEPPQVAPPAAPPVAALPPSPPIELGRSVYLLEDTFVDQDGAKRKLDVERGRPVLIAMFFASCPTVCPMLIGELQRTLGKVDPSLRDRARIVLVSLDPERDTPEVLRSVIERHKLDATRVTLMTGDDDATRNVAALLGISYRAGEGTINHSSAIALLNGDGVIVASAEPASAQLDGLVERLNELAAKAQP